MRRASATVGALLVMLTLPAVAQAVPRTWISGFGDDANPCSRTAPCKTWAGAYAATSVGGEIDALDSGGFGTLTIGHSITLSGAGVNASILAGSVSGLVVAAPTGSNVVIHDVNINGISGGTGIHGIDFQSGSSLRVEGGTIFGFGSNGINDQSTTPGSQLIVANESIYNNTGNGVFLGPPGGVAGSAVLSGSYIDGNGCGLVVAGFGPGAGTCGTATSGTAAQGATATSYNTSITNNAGTGVYSGGAPAQNAIASDLITGNGTGLATAGGGTIVSVGASNVVFGNANDGSPTSIHPTGAVGPAGPAGANGANGAQGAAGQIELVTCKTTTVTVKKKVKGKTKKVKKTIHKCTGKLVSGPVTFTVAGKIVRATLTRSGQIYATGSMWMGTNRTEGTLTLRRSLTRGRYTLKLSRGRTVLSRRVVLAG